MRHDADDHPTLRKKDLAELLASRLGLSKTMGREAAQLMLDEIVERLIAGGRVEFRDCFVLETRSARPRAVRNPRTGELATMPSRRVLRIKPGRRLRQALNGAEGAGGAAVKSDAPPLRLAGAGEAPRNGQAAPGSAPRRRCGS